MILVVEATGQLGGMITRRLPAPPVPLEAVVRRDRAPALAGA
jgi:uncharacterized protein YbjT (DUF2867 family)